MNIAAVFGDDEHTASEDSYARAMKCRKWVVFAAAAYFLVHAGAFSPTKFSVLVGEVTLTVSTYNALTVVGLAYSVLQYALLIFQLGVRYRSVLEHRFGLREEHRLGQLRSELGEITARINELEHRQAQASAVLLNPKPEAADRRISALTKRAETLAEEIAKSPISWKPPTPYIVSEIMIDIMRLFGPVLAAIVALWASHS